jgi:3'(2'), 5'-bisphosphate nucleotidase
MKHAAPHIIQLLQQAGELIMEVYRGGTAFAEVEWKADNSPLTLADRKSHDFLFESLQQLDASIPIMSEESVEIDFDVRKHWHRYWCLDPLDGTKEFVKRNDQFTINLALIENSRPVLSFIHVPVTGHTYWAIRGEGAFKQDGDRNIRIRSNNKNADWIAVGSNSHGSDAEAEWMKQFPVKSHIKVGSALKFCHIASGLADVYFRSGPTMEWDTSAGHLLVEEAGATFSYVTENTIHYNKPSLLNPPFWVSIPV